MPPAPSPPPLHARHWLALGAICIVGLALRTVSLEISPPGLWFDEGLNGQNALGILNGETPLYFNRQGLPQEPLHMYAIAAVMVLVGPSALSIRLTSAIIGTLTLPVVFGCFREAFHSNRGALIVTAGLAVMQWHVHFSRLGLRTIWVPLATAAACWLALIIARRPDKRLAIVLGLILAAAGHTYLAARLLPFLMLALLAWDMTHRPYRRGLGGAIAITAVVFLIGIAPLTIHLIRNPALFEGRVADIALFPVAAEEDAEGGLAKPPPATPPDTPIGQGRRVLGGVGENLLANIWVFTAFGDHVPTHGLPRVPVFDPITGFLFLVGLVAAFAGWGHGPGRAMLVMWLGVMLMASVLSFGAPNVLRTLAVAPAALGLAVLGLERVTATVRLEWGRRAALGVSLAWLAWFAADQTLRGASWSQRDDVWMQFNSREVTVARLIADLPATDDVAVFNGWLGNEAFTFLTHGRGDMIPLTTEPAPLNLSAVGANRLHLFLFTALPPQAAALERMRAGVPDGVPWEEVVLRAPDGRPYATHVIVGPRDAS